MNSFTFYLPTYIYFGEKILDGIGATIKDKGFKKPMVVTDKGILAAGLFDIIEGSLKENGIEYYIYDKIEPNPRSEIMYNGAEEFKAQKCDCIIAIGGGGPIDSSKAIGMLATNGGKAEDYEGFGKVKNDLPFTIAVPTTYGTGSEVSNACIITDPARHVKMFIGDDHLSPSVAMIDPRLLVALPLKIAATTGIDALTHAIESLVSKTASPISDALNEHAIRTIANNLLPAATTNDNMEATSAMVMASCMTAAAFNYTALGLVHSIAHSLGGLYNIAHGLANSLLLPYVMEYNLPSRPEKFALIAQLLNVDIEGMDDIEAGYAGIEQVRKISGLLGIPTSLSAIGIGTDKFEEIAEAALRDGNIGFNPRTVGKADVIAILNKAL